MKRFDYFEPATLNEAVLLLGQHKTANLLAGGTDLLVEIKEKIRAPDVVINIKKIPGLDQLRYDEQNGLHIGASVTAREVETSAVVQEKYAGLHTAVQELGSIQVRNRATVVGNICRASPSADTLPPLIADGATVSIFGKDGTRTLLLENFFTGPGQTVLSNDEVVTAVTVPPPQPNTCKVYIKHGRRQAMELATVGVAVNLIRANDVCLKVRIALGAVAPTPIRARRAEAILEGQPISQELIAQAAEAAQQEARPISDVRASESYRSQMVKVLTRRALASAWEAT